MAGQRLSRAEDQIRTLFELDFLPVEQADDGIAPNLRNQRLDFAGIDLIWRLAQQYEDDRAIRSVAATGQRQRAEELCRETRNPLKIPSLGDALHKITGSAHRPHSVRTRWPYANFEDFKNAGFHNSQAAKLMD